MRVSCLLFSVFLTACAGTTIPPTESIDPRTAEVMDDILASRASDQEEQQSGGGSGVCRTIDFDCGLVDGTCRSNFRVGTHIVQTQFGSMTRDPEDKVFQRIITLSGSTDLGRPTWNHYSLDRVHLTFVEDPIPRGQCDRITQSMSTGRPHTSATIILPMAEYDRTLEVLESSTMKPFLTLQHSPNQSVSIHVDMMTANEYWDR